MEVENPQFFERPSDFWDWLEINYEQLDSAWIGFYKKGSGIPSMTWSESVDQALCFGWVDGLRKTIDDKSYAIRFTPRRKTSTWSQVNLNKMKDLMAAGLVNEKGLQIYKSRKKELEYSYEQRNVELDKKYLAEIKKNPGAYEFYCRMTKSVKKPSNWWVMSAKKEETRLRRLNILIERSAKGLKIPMLSPK